MDNADTNMSQPRRVAFVSLGCAKNLVDSEKMLGQLAEAGCIITADESQADVIVVNTCGFLEASRTEADEVVAEALDNKRSGGVQRVVVAGCLVQRDKQAMLDRLPGIDALVGVNNRDDVVRAVLGESSSGAADRKTDIYLSDYHPFTQLDTARLRITPRHYAYLRISEGCDQKCTFCTIPSIRGEMHCKPPSMIMTEARELVSDGVAEISLIGQDTTSYGLGEDPIEGGLAGLLRQLNRLDGLRWLRLMYVYPTVLSDDILDAVAQCEKVCNYIDIPLQHINSRVLKSMHRRIDRRETELLLKKIRDSIPGVAIRTTLISGFPGETQAEHDELVEFVKDFKFDALGVFPYSLEADTPSGRMPDQVHEQVKRDRTEELMLAQQEVAFAAADECVGKTFEVLIDSVEKDGSAIARHQGQAPSVDSVVQVTRAGAKAGEFIYVRCTARDNYDLIAVPTQVSLPVLGL